MNAMIYQNQDVAKEALLKEKGKPGTV